jgi:hypothetical protein
VRKVGLSSLAFFYCDFREDRKKKLGGLLSSFLVQLCHQSDSYFDILSNFYSEHGKGLAFSQRRCTCGMFKGPAQTPRTGPRLSHCGRFAIWTNICPNPSVVRSLSPRAKVLSFIQDLVATQIRNRRVCVTSRPELDIKDVLDPLIFHSVSCFPARRERTKEGYRGPLYIKSAINTFTTRRWKEGHRKLAIDVLVEKSNGV